MAANPVVLGIVAIVAAIGALIYVAGQATREVEEMTAALVENYRLAAEAEKDAIDESYSAHTKFFDYILSSAETVSTQRQKDLQTEYDAEIKSLSKREQAMKKSLQERGKALDDAHKTAIDQIRAEYGVFEEKQKTKTEIVQEEADAQKTIVQDVLSLSKDIATQEGEAFSKTYDAILEKASSIHDEKLRMYQEEYLQSVMLINQDLAKKIGGYQDEINLLNGKTEEENRIEKEQSDLQKLADLQAKIDAAENDADRVQATKDLNTEISRQNREKELADRQKQIDFLNEQIKTATEKANEEKQNVLRIFQEKTDGQQKILDADTKHTIEKIQEERIAKEKAEDLKYAATKNSIDRQTEELDGWSERETERLQAELAEKQKLEADKLQSVRDGVTNQIAEIQRLADAEKAAVDERFRIQSLQAKIDAIRSQENQIMNRPWYERTSVTNAIDAINISKFEQQIAILEDQIAGHGGGGRSIPGFATGVVDWQGGLARVNERGGEIQYLERGTTVIPNDISMQIAKSVGQAVGAAVGSLMSGNGSGITAKEIADAMAGLTINVDGRQFGRVVREYV